ncbi:MAG TPA: L,D-transpeptidase family protein [Geobacteraceae bacterium]|nr:L,D-transpeptidase family protein [Geobacteraceae bacterium]
MKIFFLFLCCFLFAVCSASAEYFYAADGDVVGKIQQYQIKRGESLIEIARKFDLGWNEISDANPEVDPFIPPAGLKVVIPAKWIIPDVPVRRGVVINISEMRLYYFLGKGTNLMTTFPIGVGDEGKETPVGAFRIIQKIVSPSWHVPKSIKEEKPELPSVVPPGPDNPLGSYAMRLSVPSVLIHGTNKPWAVGRRATHGCLRLYPEDIPRLFLLVKNGERVTIVKQPVKAGVLRNRVLVEVHKYGDVNYLREALKALGGKGLLGRIDRRKLTHALEEKSGMPVDITAGE